MRKILAMASVMMLGASGAWALGTTAGMDINNSATLSYSAGNVSQPDVDSNTDTFKVDKKVDMVLEINDANHVPGALGQQNVITSFSFKNEGNSNERFNFHVTNMNGGSSDNTDSVPNDTQDVSHLIISCNYVDENGNNQTATSASAGADIVIFTQVDSSATCTVSATLPTGVNDGEVMNIELNATAYKDNTTAETETTAGDTQGSVDVVFADGETIHNGSTPGNLGDTAADDNASSIDMAGDGSDVAVNGYIIQTPVLALNKTSCVISDPVNNTTSPKRIPGAIIRYMFDIDNTGTGDVSDLNITDTINTNLYTTGTKASAKKDENQTSCACGTEPGTDISSDTTVTGQSLLIEKINVAHGSTTGSPGHKHTCVSVEVEIK